MTITFELFMKLTHHNDISDTELFELFRTISYGTRFRSLLSRFNKDRIILFKNIIQQIIFLKDDYTIAELIYECDTVNINYYKDLLEIIIENIDVEYMY